MTSKIAIALCPVVLAAVFGRADDATLRVRASASAAPCVEASGRAWGAAGGAAIRVEAGHLRDAGAWDVLVGSGVELTRALEGGDAVGDSDQDVATIPWVIVRARGVGAALRGLEDLAQADAWMLGGPEAYEVRRVLAEKGTVRVRETNDPRKLRSASFALVPLSLAGPGERVAVDVPPIRVSAAVGARSPRADAARRFVQYLASNAGQQAFAACAPPQ